MDVNVTTGMKCKSDHFISILMAISFLFMMIFLTRQVIRQAILNHKTTIELIKDVVCATMSKSIIVTILLKGLRMQLAGRIVDNISVTSKWRPGSKNSIDRGYQHPFHIISWHAHYKSLWKLLNARWPNGSGDRAPYAKNASH